MNKYLDPSAQKAYIQGINGIHFGSNIEMGAGVRIISSNHQEDDYSISKKTSCLPPKNKVNISSNFK